MYTTGSMVGQMVVPGMLVVFAVLIILIACVKLMSHVVGGLDKKDKGAPPPSGGSDKPAPVAPAAAKPAAVMPAPAAPPTSPVHVAPVVGGEVIAAISAAVANVMESPFAITSVTPAAAGAVGIIGSVDVPLYAAPVPAQPQRKRPAWGFAGMQQNTRPF